MQRRILSGLAALAAALPLASHAETMNYSYAELGYVDTSLDGEGRDVDGDGFALRGSLAVHPNFFVFAAYVAYTGAFCLPEHILAHSKDWPWNKKIHSKNRSLNGSKYVKICFL